MDFSQRRRVGQQADVSGAARNTGAVGASAARLARKPRHAGILAAVRRFDMRIGQAEREELARWIRDEYQTELGDIPIGLVAQCFLGPPYVDHRLDLFGNIVEHYAPADPMPEPYSAARMLVRTGAYAFVEVYGSGELRPVLPDGTVVI